MRQRKAQRHQLAVDSTTFAPMCSGRDRAYRGGWVQTEPQIGALAVARAPAIRVASGYADSTPRANRP